MTELLMHLSSNQLHRSIKPSIFSCFGDLALPFIHNFDKYLLYAMPMLQSAVEVYAHTSGADDDMTEYTNSLTNGILKAYSGILLGFKDSNKHDAFLMQRTLSLDESLDRYSQLFEKSFSKETKWQRSKCKSSKLTNEDNNHNNGHGPS
ncbi:hypothetical protein JHK87_039453 [Glycine soja]|nr:hypothetical protein JHK87_039453 [Glycine soja]